MGIFRSLVDMRTIQQFVVLDTGISPKIFDSAHSIRINVSGHAVYYCLLPVSSILSHRPSLDRIETCSSCKRLTDHLLIGRSTITENE